MEGAAQANLSSVHSAGYKGVGGSLRGQNTASYKIPDRKDNMCEFGNKVAVVINEAIQRGLDLELLKKEAIGWCQDRATEDNSVIQQELRRLLIDLSTLGLQEVFQSMEGGTLPLAAAAWSRELEAEASEVLVERISVGLWRTLFRISEGKHSYFLRRTESEGIAKKDVKGALNSANKHGEKDPRGGL